MRRPHSERPSTEISATDRPLKLPGELHAAMYAGPLNLVSVGAEAGLDLSHSQGTLKGGVDVWTVCCTLRSLLASKGTKPLMILR